MSPRPYLYYRLAPAHELAAAVDTFKDELSYLYLESEATIELMAYTRPDPNWTHGRAFGKTLEVRWQSVSQGFELLLLTEVERQPPGWEAVSAATAGLAALPDEVTSGQTLLWGTHLRCLQQPHHLAGGKGEAWIETRLPRPLRYPLSGSPCHVKARVMIYSCQGRSILTRLVSLEGEDDEPQPLW